MSRTPRIYFDGALYHVTSRGDHREEIFRDDIDCEEYLQLLGKYKNQYRFKLFCFVLMPNHVHLLVEPAPGTTISEIMHDINSTYTKFFNRRHKRIGHLFQERFYAIIVDKDTYLMELTRYIHLNPVRARMIDRPERYRWSSYPAYLKIVPRTIFEVDSEEVLGLISAEEKEERVRLYREFVESVREREVEELREKLRTNSLLGSNEFVQRLREQFGIRTRGRPRKKDNEK